MIFKLYETLGLNRNDDPSQQEIKKAYHKKALKHHPDKNPNNKDNEILFKEISNAYTILSDENKKRTYDNLGDDNYQEGNQNDMNPEDIFQHFFGNNNNPFGSPFSSSFNFDFNRKQNRKCSNITKIINVTLEDVYNGIDSTMKINVKNNCLNCINICNECDGRGVTQMMRNLGLMQQIIQKTSDELGLDAKWIKFQNKESFINKKSKKTLIKINEKLIRNSENYFSFANPKKIFTKLRWKAKTNLDTLIKIMIKKIAINE